ncbi:helix-turn-helix domain-containing protein [Defluviimonas sp. WL0002]|uniref:Helix-turn-helix domain-containing protein n=1 Tax=Albidovulum marisflavi TaxID=2984159 RepID=A0ABT2ZC25_9RHOB|nr:helix-turn-helix domain-containing protein [Defluviimonas sp. WL0002]MCV2868669.1 helix-turn-helix domain-containing protein [Defluviimonas sp. WL0002]
MDNSTMPFRVAVLLFEDFSNMVLSCLMEPLRVVRDQSGVDLAFVVLTAGDRSVGSSSGLRVAPDTTLAAAGAFDLCLLVGGDRFREAAVDPDLRRNLRPIRRSAFVIAADTGAWLMAAAGLLEGRCATLHWHLVDEFAETFPGVSVSSDRHVRDGNLWTCGSAATGLDLILAFIRDRFGSTAAFEAEAMFLHDSARQATDPRFGPGLRGRSSEKLRRVVARMSATIEAPPTLSELARGANLSERSLNRLFHRELGQSPARYLQFLRLARARDLATHTDLGLEEIALRCGFSSASALSRAFAKRTGTPIRRAMSP